MSIDPLILAKVQSDFDHLDKQERRVYCYIDQILKVNLSTKIQSIKNKLWQKLKNEPTYAIQFYYKYYSTMAHLFSAVVSRNDLEGLLSEFRSKPLPASTNDNISLLPKWENIQRHFPHCMLRAYYAIELLSWIEHVIVADNGLDDFKKKASDSKQHEPRFRREILDKISFGPLNSGKLLRDYFRNKIAHSAAHYYVPVNGEWYMFDPKTTPLDLTQFRQWRIQGGAWDQPSITNHLFPLGNTPIQIGEIATQLLRKTVQVISRLAE